MLRIRDEPTQRSLIHSNSATPAPALIFAPVSATREPCRRVRAEQSLPRFEPCVPRPASAPPAGPAGIKHDGFRILAHRRGRNVRLFSASATTLRK